MPSYVITGISRGLGWEFMKQIFNDPANTAIGTVRNKPLTDKRVTEELSSRPNITILAADVTNYNELKNAVTEAATITRANLDYLIASAAYISSRDQFDSVGAMSQQPQMLLDEFHKSMEINVLANVHLYNLFLPQILKGSTKKVIAITSGIADIDWINDYEIEELALNAMSKAAFKLLTAKFNAQYKRNGVLFLSICPGLVDTGRFVEPTTEQKTQLEAMMARFVKYSPSFKGLITPTDSVEAILSVMNNSSIGKGDAGRFLSHFGNRQWL